MNERNEPFEKFSERARLVLVRAQEFATKYSHNYIGTQHLLAGLLSVKECIAVQILGRMNVDLDNLSGELEKIISSKPSESDTELGLTPGAKRAIERAVEEARQMRDQHIGTEHILAGLLKADDSSAKKLLLKRSVDFETLRDHIVNSRQKLSQGAQVGGGRTKHFSKTPVINEFGSDLTALAQAGKLDPVIGRQTELQRLMQILCRRIKNNPVLIGEPGVGKTAIVEKLATLIASGEAPEPLLNRRVVSLEMGTLVAGTKYRGEFEERLRKLLAEVKNAGNLIIFIDEIHTMIGAGAAEGAVDAANMLKPSLARGAVQVVGATTIKDYRRYVERDPALERRFQPVTVEPPSADTSLDILSGVKARYEEHHNLTITNGALLAAVQLSDRYINDRELPDKAIDLIDEAAARVRLRSSTTSLPVHKAEHELEQVRDKKQSAIQNQLYEKAATLRDRELILIEEIEVLKREAEQKKPQRRNRVTAEDIAEIVSQWTQIPVTRLKSQESKSLIKIEQELERLVIGQKEAIKVVAQAVRRGRVGFKDPNRPTASLMFLGPTGVGKTYLVKSLAKLLFGKEDAMVRFDMSEYMERHTVSKLIGAPPSYVGHEDGGQLTEAVRKKSYCIVLLDEIEKAHPDVFNLLLQVMEDGRLTDGKGRTVDFRNVILVMTSNLGSQHMFSQSKIGFGGGNSREDREYESIKSRVLDEVNSPDSGFRPEFSNRLDAIVVFRPLEQNDIIKIVKLTLNEVQARLLSRGVALEVAKPVWDYLAEKGFDHKLGARPLRRLIQEEVEDPLSEMFLKGQVKPSDSVKISLSSDHTSLTFVPQTGKQPASSGSA